MLRLATLSDKHQNYLSFMYHQEKCASVQRECILESTILSVVCLSVVSAPPRTPVGIPLGDGAEVGNLQITGSHGFCE